MPTRGRAMRHSDDSTFATAYKLLTLGFSVIPSGGDKVPLVEWKEYQQRQPSLADLEAWQRVEPLRL